MKLLPVRTVADTLGYSYETVRRLAKGGELTYVQMPGCAIRIPESALLDYLERYTWPAQESPRASSASRIEKTGTSATVAKSLARELRMERKQNVS